MKLELKHLAPYLPYKLRVQYWNRNIVMNAGSGSSTNWIGITALLQRQGEKHNCYPILRPLSEATEVIKNEFPKYHKGFDYDKDVVDFFDSDLIGDIDEIDNLKIDYLPYGAVNWLIKNHYDIFNLIPKGLAIDINTL